MSNLLHTLNPIPLSHWGVITIKGADAKTFLQGQLTVQMDDIKPTQGSLGAYCNLKGRLHGVFYVIDMSLVDEGYALVMPISIIPHMLLTLKKFAMFSKVTLEDASNQYALTGYPLENPKEEPFAFKAYFETKKIEQALALYLPQARILCLESKQRDITDQNAQWDYLDIEAGLPFIFSQTLETFLPHYLNLNTLGSINFQKGCYLGQEIIARMEYKGNIKKHLYQAVTDSPNTIPYGCEIHFEGKPVGSVLYSAFGPQGLHCLATIEDALIDKNLKLNYANSPNLFDLKRIEAF